MTARAAASCIEVVENDTKSARITSYLTSFGDEMAGPSDLSRFEDDLAEMITGDHCGESGRGIS